MSSFVKCSAEVAELLSQDALDTVRRTTNQYTCAGCKKPGKARRERTNVVIFTGDGPPVISFAHARCLPSQVIESPESTLADRCDGGNEEILSQQILWPTSEGYLAGLVIDRPIGVTALRPTGDLEDLWTQLLLDQGWELLLHISQPCPQVTTTTLELSSTGRGRVMLDDPYRPGKRIQLVDQLPDLMPEWIAAVRSTGVVRIIAGAIGSTPGTPLSEPQIVQAIQLGKMVGAVVPVVRVP
ncbi:hypothetical protein C1Y40_04535 [Mycobacterium talmoniae]|uniref:Uncharacterized protein n=1 Tax=Mycobacterium talmoniae TaxID=1858794 RepID=A0A2S8BF67_9MYCO|nr:hypothetical protein [Mycobacterium eburneum]PQM45310.1 hypothetical protein C1Y40_04535 [Mycobacterium talmoniae]TDH48472.1 hypothetical protein E2F47_23690 [Mycobacterium eburneum]